MLCTISLPAAGQSSGVQQTWRMESLQAGYCIEFLMEADLARRELPRGMTPVPARDVPTLHPAVASAVAERPDSLGTWAPSELCFYWTDAVDVDGRRVAERNDRLQAVGVWSIMARPDDQPSAAPTPVGVRLLASNWRAAGLGRAVQIDFERMDAAAGKTPVESPETGEMVPGSDDRYWVKLGKTTITWDGRIAGDSTTAGTAAEPVGGEWRMPGLRQTNWTVRSQLRPTAARPVVGALRVVGKDRLAKALMASPIRFVGPWYWGGPAELVFTR